MHNFSIYTSFLILHKISFQYINFPRAKMGSKALFFFCISLAVVLTITSQAAGRELAETFTSVNNPKTRRELGTPHYGGSGDPRGGGHGGNLGGWAYGGSGYPGQAVDAEP
ncbi:uncharacterized protein LOC113764036 [Coffea eugenioides]|uniref:uncharacterized protein LOC113764030 n=1 Tax=Coffea eugenioides TaxID=49369 RepID=UPI000F614789|nr:uncharacterized protein LOC113764030 [Coffea eugenioides]XP_027163875.1 uncharacterized protein LOC113764036 [Coffea eugenioides]